MNGTSLHISGAFFLSGYVFLANVSLLLAGWQRNAFIRSAVATVVGKDHLTQGSGQ